MANSMQKMRFPLYNDLWALKIQDGGQFPMVNIKSSEVFPPQILQVLTQFSILNSNYYIYTDFAFSSAILDPPYWIQDNFFYVKEVM
jgi:hypothetical protein